MHGYTEAFDAVVVATGLELVIGGAASTRTSSSALDPAIPRMLTDMNDAVKSLARNGTSSSSSMMPMIMMMMMMRR